MTTVVFPGSFDPVTAGHADIVMRAASLFDEVIVAVAQETGKQTLFTLEERLNFVKDQFSGQHNVRVMAFEGLLVNFLRENGWHVVVRGVRGCRDFEYEQELAEKNRALDSFVETVFLLPSEGVRFVSSSFVREAARLGADVSSFVMPTVQQALQRKYRG